MAIAVECSVDGGLVFYSRFIDDTAVETAYESLRAASGIERDTGPGCAEGPFEAAYGAEGGSPGGRLLCQLADGAYISMWTHADEPILAGLFLDSEAGFPILAETWQRARLAAGTAALPSASSAPSPSEGPAASTRPVQPSAPAASSQTRTRGLARASRCSSGRAPRAPARSTGTTHGARTRPLARPTRRSTETSAPPGRHPAAEVGHQWLEVGYDVAVRPTEVVIWESSGADS